MYTSKSEKNSSRCKIHLEIYLFLNQIVRKCFNYLPVFIQYKKIIDLSHAAKQS